jgi:hypothetical protein
VLAPGARERELYLPAGRWVDLWRSATYDSARGALRLGRASTLSGGRLVTVPAPLDELPLLVRAGAILPLLPPQVDTLADEGEQPGLVHLGERRRRLRLLAFPRGRSSADLGPGVRARSRARRGRWTLRIRSGARRRYQLQASMTTLRRAFRPRCVRVGGRRLPRRRWRYVRSTGVLRASFALRRGRIVVSRSACRK